jgi:endo-1,3-1,4-beta-glycanase ExoK
MALKNTLDRKPFKFTIYNKVPYLEDRFFTGYNATQNTSIGTLTGSSSGNFVNSGTPNYTGNQTSILGTLTGSSDATNVSNYVGNLSSTLSNLVSSSTGTNVSSYNGNHSSVLGSIVSSSTSQNVSIYSGNQNTLLGVLNGSSSATNSSRYFGNGSGVFTLIGSSSSQNVSQYIGNAFGSFTLTGSSSGSFPVLISGNASGVLGTLLSASAAQNVSRYQAIATGLLGLISGASTGQNTSKYQGFQNTSLGTLTGSSSGSYRNSITYYGNQGNQGLAKLFTDTSDFYKSTGYNGFWNTPTLTGQWSDTKTTIVQDTLRLELTTVSNGSNFQATASELTSNLLYGFGTYELLVRSASTSNTPNGVGNAVPGNVTGVFLYVNNSETEIDFEIQGKSPNQLDTVSYSGLSNKHYQFNPTVDLSQGFHTYKLIWQPDRMEFYLDNVLKWTNTLDVPQKNAYLIFNLWATNDVNFGGLSTVGSVYAYVKSAYYKPNGFTLSGISSGINSIFQPSKRINNIPGENRLTLVNPEIKKNTIDKEIRVIQHSFNARGIT